MLKYLVFNRSSYKNIQEVFMEVTGSKKGNVEEVILALIHYDKDNYGLTE
ncbi:hypothetical protein RBU49_13380 [Clostridium sp. MB40-C1]|nr:hypothetical protein [Clostridium sp. MB40-C1]WMJ79851.1 hypothetical protein RBU49_13380 [Clostridium sp. MB40-C1]